jgi:hypothetical protein
VCAEDRSDRHLPDAHARGSMRGHKGSDAVQHTRLPSGPPTVHSPRHPSRMLSMGLRRRLRKRCYQQVLAQDRSDRHVHGAHARASMRGHKGSDAVQHTRLPSGPPRVHCSRHPNRMLQVSSSDMYKTDAITM